MSQTTPTTAADEFAEHGKSPMQRVQSTLHKYPWVSPLVVLALLIIIFIVMGLVFDIGSLENFIKPNTISLMLQQTVIVGTLAIAQTIVILTAGIDLSIGAIMVFGQMVMANLAVYVTASNVTFLAGQNPVVAVLAGILVATLAGALNGFLIVRFNLPPFIVTLGTLNIAFAITQLYSGSQTVTEVSDGLTWLGNSFRIGETNILYGVVLMLALYLITWLFLRETAPGRHIYAVGNSPEATRLTGISTDKVLLGVYVLAGVFYGLASLLSVARIGAGDPNAGQTENLDAITAVVLGGTSLFGGRGMILGTLVGALIVGVFRNGLTLMGVSSVYQILVTGILVILAVATDQLSRKGVR